MRLIFLAFTLVALFLQIGYSRLLAKLLPPFLRRWNPWILLALNLPLLLDVCLRAAHLGMPGTFWVRSLGRIGLILQALAALHLATWGLTILAGRWRQRRHRKVLVDEQRRAFLRNSILTSSGLLLLAGSGGAVQAYGDPELNRLNLHFPDLPQGMDGLRILHLTDLHAGPLVRKTTLLRWRTLAERERPDVVIITGDFVDSQPDEMTAIEEAFGSFSAPLGRFAILGNHDYFTDPRPIWKSLERMGFQCLENAHALIERNDSHIVVFGLQDPMARNGQFRGLRFGPGPMPRDVALRMPQSCWRLALCHRPSNWNLALEAGAHLTLSGHTHGGQINLVPGVSSAKLMGRFTSGIYREGHRLLFVNRGLGVVGLPMRVGAPPEISLLTLHRSENPALHSRENEIASFFAPNRGPIV